MKQYQLVITPMTREAYLAYYVLIGDKVNQFPENEDEWVVDKTIKGVLKKVKKIAPKDGQVMFTFLNRKPVS